MANRKKPGSAKGVPKPVKRELDPQFSERLKSAMMLKSLDPRKDVPKLAKAVRCERATLHRYLKGRPKKIDAHLFLDLAEYLGVDARWLLTAGIRQWTAPADIERRVTTAVVAR